MGDGKLIRTTVFIVGDQDIPRQALVHLLKSRPEYTIAGEADVAGAESANWDATPDVVLVHAAVATTRILQLLQTLKERHIPTTVLLRHRYPWLVHSCYKAGATAVVLLHAKTSDFFQAIDTAAQHRRYLDPSLSEAMLDDASAHSATGARELSAREAQVLKYVAYGYKNSKIAEILNVSTKSVETYRARLMEKLNLRDRPDLVRFALSAGILDIEDIDEGIAG